MRQLTTAIRAMDQSCREGGVGANNARAVGVGSVSTGPLRPEPRVTFAPGTCFCLPLSVT